MIAPHMGASDARKLKDEAAQAVAKGKWKRALDVYLQLERAEPNDGMWPRKTGEMLRRLAKIPEAIHAFDRAVDLHARDGFLLKAIAVSTLILELDENHTATQQKLASLYSAKSGATSAPIFSAPSPPTPRPPTEPPLHLPASAGLDELELEPIMGDSGFPSSPTVGVFEVPLSQGDQEGFAAAFGDFMEKTDSGRLISETRENAAQAKARATLPLVPLFSSLDEDRLRMLIERVKLVELVDGEVLFAEGEVGETLYVVAGGEVAVEKGGVEVARLGEGTFFGEIALVTDQARNATIVGTSHTTLLAIDRKTVSELIHDAPDVLKVLLRFLRDRLIASLIETNALFAPFSGEERKVLVDKFQFLEAQADLELIHENESAAGLFVLLSGQVDVIADDRVVATLGPGDLFGEISLLTHERAIATIRTTSKCYLLRMDRRHFTELIMTHPQVLEFINAVVDDRRRKLEQIRAGQGDYREGNVRTI